MGWACGGHLVPDGLGEASKGIAVDSGSGTVYASDFGADYMVVFASITLPTVALEPLGGQSPRAVTMNGVVDPEGSPVTSEKRC